jgi:DNA replication and repair protein RecF
MRLRNLELNEFRSFRKLDLAIDEAGFRVVGPNASGKSTLLEAISMLATARSPRTSVEREIPNWMSGTDLAVPRYARVSGRLERADGQHRVEIGLSLDERGANTLKKHIRLDERPARAVDVVGQFKVVLFSPEDVDLVSGAPSARRRYLDMSISQASRPYLRALSSYGRVLEQRNSLLRAFSRSRVSPGSPQVSEELSFWDHELSMTAVDLLAVRVGAVRFLSDRARFHFGMLADDDSLEMKYTPSRYILPEDPYPGERWDGPSRDFRQQISAAYTAALRSWQAEELRRGVSAVGPHRDDFVVQARGVDLGRYGSRGQQRLALIAIKLAELEMLSETAGEPPVLLLDDVLSELDPVHRTKVIGMIASRNAQICVTATDVQDLDAPELKRLPLLTSRPGEIQTV